MTDIDPSILAGIAAAMSGKKSGDDGNGGGDNPPLVLSPVPPAPDRIPTPPAPVPDPGKEFFDKWEPRTEGLERFWRLLSSEHEDDFSGVIIVDDHYYFDEFVGDIAKMLASLGKLKSSDAMDRTGIVPMAISAVTKLINLPSEDHKAIPVNKLLVVEGVGQFPPPVYQAMPGVMTSWEPMHSRLFTNALGRIVDKRYVILAGTSEEVDGFIHEYPVLAPTFGENVVRLKGMDPSGILDAYCDNLDNDLLSQISDQFKATFKDYVEFNGDILNFKGAELADRLAKEANATRDLVLPEDRYSASSLEGMLSQIVGLEKVKQAIRGLESYATFMKRAEGHGSKLPSSNLHMVFEGNPGTGKTMVARLISTMLYKIGILRTPKFVETSSKDLIGKYVGWTDKAVADKVKEAMGGVLFIDEAYALMPQGDDTEGGFGAEAVAELVKEMEDHKDDLVVILAGYEKEMQGLIDSNPGLASRIGYTFHFDDYSVDELLDIFRLKTDAAGLTIGAGVEEELTHLFAYFSRFKSFGNGRFVDEVLQKTLVRHAQNCAGKTANTASDYLTIAVADVPSRQDMFDVADWEPRSAEEMLEPLVGLGVIKDEVLALEKTVAYREVALKANIGVPDLNLNMVFRGNPGTGKTTVARIIGSVLYNIGAVPNNHFEEIEAKDLVNSRVGGVAKETNKVIERAMGGVLFLDEAYALMDSGAGREALAVLVKAMEDHKGELVVMFAGYEKEMRAFINENPGLASRIGYTFDFEDYDADSLLEIFSRKMAAAGFSLGDGVLDGARDAFRYFHSVENFGNGRFVDRYIQELIAGHAGCYDPQNPELVGKDALPTIKRLCELSATEVLDCTDDEEEAALRRVSIHEAGHAVCRLAATGKTDIVLITVEHEGNGALGYVQHENKGMSLPTARNLRDELVCLLGGMSAEEVYFGSFSAGNSSDLDKATAIACRYVATYGMSDAGLIQFANAHFDMGDLAKLPNETLAAMTRVLDECHGEARRRVEECRGAIDAITAALKEKSTLTGEELLAIWKDSAPTGVETA